MSTDDNRNTVVTDPEIVKRIPRNVSGNLMKQVLLELRRDAPEVFRYLWATIRGIFTFILKSPISRTTLLFKYLRVFINVEGGVSLLEILELTNVVENRKSNGILVEVGTWKGLSACCLSHVAKRLQTELWIIDTFSGLPRSGGPFMVSEGLRRGYQFEEGTYAGSYASVMENMARFGVPDNVRAIAGDVTELPKIEFSEGRKIAVAFIDVDLPDSYRGAFRAISGGIDEQSKLVLHEGLLDDVRAIAEDKAFWSELSLPAPRVTLYERKWGFRTLMTCLEFDGN